jgi:membrane-bound lytic murein transglycosylase A
MRAVAAGALLLAASLTPMLELRAEPTGAGEVRLEVVPFSALVGWHDDDHCVAFAVFRRSCAALVNDHPALRPADAASQSLRAVCQAALALPDADQAQARGFFEANFDAVDIVPPSGRGFLTGYFEPEYDGSLTPTEAFKTPLLARPADLITVPQGETLPGLAPGLQAARRTDAGLEPYPDRAAIEDGALGGRAAPIMFLRDPVDAFVVHVQGSARIRLPDGRTRRIAYAGRNGHPYTSIGRILVERGHIPLEEMSLERLVGWLREHPDEARAIMRQNRSYIFFRVAEDLDPNEGPIGGAGIPLTPGRSLAVDRARWSYGLPFWLEGELPTAHGASEPLRRLMIAQDTGTAIVGPARGDFFVGSGPEAGTRAGLLRHGVRFVVLRPKERP